MAGIGIIADAHALIDGQEAAYLSVSDVAESIDAGVTQRVYADNTQRAILGYATQSAYTLAVQTLDDATYEWIRSRVGRQVIWRDLAGTLAQVIVGNLARNKKAGRSETEVWNARLTLFLVSASVNSGLPDDADLDIFQ